MTDAPTPESPEPRVPRKGPLSFLSGALTAGLLAWLALGLSRRMVVYFAVHPPHYSSPIAQNIAVTLKTLLVGLSFLATFSSGFVALGLTLFLLYPDTMARIGLAAAITFSIGGLLLAGVLGLAMVWLIQMLF